MKRTVRFLATAAIFLIVMNTSTQGQIPNSMFFMPGVPQSNRINPAIQPGCGFYLGFPGAAPLRLQIRSSSLGFNDFIFYNSDIDSLITPLHPLADKEDFLKNLRDVNFFQLDAGTSLASFGFRAGESYFSVDIIPRMEGAIFYPKGMFELVLNGLPNDEVLSFSGIGADLSVFNEFSLGWSRKNFILKNLDIGIRGKALFGIANFTTKQSELELATSMDSWNLHSDFEVSASAPGFVTFDENVEDADFSEWFDDTFFSTAAPMEIVQSILNFDRFGMAFDAGINYRILPQLQLSASVLDLGGIKWNNTIKGSFNFDYEFTGLDANPFTGIDTTFLSEIVDSLDQSYAFETGQPYFSKLNTKLFVGASYYPIEKIGFGLLSRTDFLNQKVSQQFTGTVNMTTGKFANLSLSYSYISNKFNNLGAGISFNVGMLNMYLISDNIISGALNPVGARSVNLWFGMNLTFGWKRAAKKAVQVDRPLII
ncbi:MAG: DUF5723 family protein [Bacteroidales bacterium]|nr:DUF5723 family protein [Bacteroidales bacterium]